MRFPRFFRAAGLAAACAFFAGCQSEVLSDPNSSQQAPTAGRIAYRFDSTDLGEAGMSVDSLRIEVVREGYPTHWASGTLGQTVTIGDLDVGYWTVRVALFDRIHEIRWYGEANVLVEGGKTSPAVVHLRRASGSVDLTIVIDSAEPPPQDTMSLQYFVQAVPGSLSELRYLAVFGAWRSDSGVFIQTSTGCGVLPRVLLDPPELPVNRPGITVLALGIDRANTSLVQCPDQFWRRTIVFVPIRTPDLIRVSDTRGIGSGYELPAGPVCSYGWCDTTHLPPPSDSSFKWVEFKTSSGFALWSESVYLTYDGRIVRTIDNLGPDLRSTRYYDSIRGDTMISVISSTPYDTPGRWSDTVYLSQPALARVRAYLDTYDTRYPAQLPPSADNCPTDMPSQSAQVDYQDGRVSVFAVPGTWCGTKPASWAGLDSARQLVFGRLPMFL